MDELLKRLYGFIQPQNPVQVATSPLTSPQIGMLNRLLGLSTGQAQTALQQMPKQLAESRQLLDQYTPGQPIDPRLLDQFMNLTGFAPAGITAYHGSPYLFRQFDPSRRGTGEGAQAYGVGAGYTAEARPVAEEYKRQLATNFSVDNKMFYSGITGKKVGTTGNTDADDYLLANLGDIEKAISNAKRDMKEVVEYNPAEKVFFEKTIADLESLKSRGAVKQESSGYLYKGDIPDEILPKFLNWDKKFSEQTTEVKEAIKKYWDENKVYGDPTKLSGAGIYDSIVAHVFGDAGRLGAQQAASNELEKIGLRGIRYLDQGSRGEGKGTSNFIPFRPEDYKIESINDIPIQQYIEQGLL